MAGGSNEPLTLVNIIKLRKLKKLGKGITLPELFIQFGKYSSLCKSLLYITHFKRIGDASITK